MKNFTLFCFTFYNNKDKKLFCWKVGLKKSLNFLLSLQRVYTLKHFMAFFFA